VAAPGRISDTSGDGRVPTRIGGPPTIATSGEWGVAKPGQAFFDRVAQFTRADHNTSPYQACTAI